MSVLDQRIYHVTHIGNLAAIAASAALLAGASPVFDIAPAELRAERADTIAPGESGRMLNAYLPFFLSPDARLWQALRDHDAHPRLAPKVATADASDFVFLMSTVRQVIATSRDFVVADGNAEGALTSFALSREEAERMLARLRADATGEALLDAEFLVEGELPLDSVTLVGVANDKVRATVRDIMAVSGFMPKVSVYPPWFQRDD
jgi:hypothetical protein